MARRSDSNSAKVGSNGEVAAGTHRGQRRGHNEDAVSVERLTNGDILLAVADGMGGAQAGEIASREAVRGVADSLRAEPSDAPAAALRRAVESANVRVYELSNTKAELHGMGTTIVAALIRGSQVWVANVGDSRAYVARGGALQQVTRDHSLVAEQVRAGYLTDEEARESDQRNIITRSLGAQPAIEVDIFGPRRLSATHRLLLCSDGLHGVLADQAIHDVVASSPPKHAVNRLIDLANKRGGPDNISAVVYQAAPGPDDTLLVRLPPPLNLRRNLLLGAVVAAAVLLMLLVVLLARAAGVGIGGGAGEDKPGASAGVPPVTQTSGRASVAPSATPRPGQASRCETNYTIQEGDSFSELRPLIEGACSLAPVELARLQVETDVLSNCQQLLANAPSWDELDRLLLRDNRVRSALHSCLHAGDVLTLRSVSRPGTTQSMATATPRAQPAEQTPTPASTATNEQQTTTPVRATATTAAKKAPR